MGSGSPRRIQIGDDEFPFRESGSMLHAARNSTAARR